MAKIQTLLIVSVAFLVCAAPQMKAQSSERESEMYTTAYIKVLAQTDYEGAMELISEGLRNGKFSAMDAYTLSANLTYNYTEDYDAAAGYMRKALEQQEAEDPATRTRLLYHLATILRNGRSFAALLATCAEGRKSARAAKLSYEDQSFDFLAGNGLFNIGEEQEGVQMMRSALTKAATSPPAKRNMGI